MGRAELALHLPQHVDEVVGRPDAVDERSVAGEGGIPIDAVHVGSVVVVAHQPPGLVEHLPPLHAWLDDDAQAGQVDGDDVVGLGRFLRRDLAVGRDHPHLVTVDDDETLAVPGRREPVDGVDERVGALRGEVEALERRSRRIVVEPFAVVAERAGERCPQPGEAAGHGVQRGVASRRHRKRHHPLVEAVGVDADAGGALLGRRRVLRWCRRPAGDVGVERRRGRGGERHELRAGTVGERQVEHVGVVDRVEAARRQERQVLAVGAECRLGVGESQWRDVDRGRARLGDLGDADLGERQRARARPREPSRVRRERQRR